MSKHKEIQNGLALIFQGIDCLSTAFDHRKFTIDGRLVGDIGEVIAEIEYALTLHKTSQPKHDATMDDGREVQIKATFKESLTFRSILDCYLGFKLERNGSYRVIYNGPGYIIYDRFKHRKGIGEKILSFPIAELENLSKNQVKPEDRIPLRDS